MTLEFATGPSRTHAQGPGIRPCLLQDAAGRIEACGGRRCPFWEVGGAVLAAGCGLQRLGLVTELPRNPSLAHWLLRVRDLLQRAETRGQEAEALRLFRRLVPHELLD